MLLALALYLGRALDRALFRFYLLAEDNSRIKLEDDSLIELEEVD